jgi:hypothetical protein
MVRVEINNGAGVMDIPYVDGMTTTDLIVKMQDFTPGRHYRFNSIELYDPSQNRKLQPTDVIVDDRHYTATVWVRQVVDDQGHRVKSGLI